ncbi:CLUMA_CG009976, isoform A [Clunio marinus]|uniref:CLUMA_CG009976, isoform A n=1 Tax=Clunio marinus TaxID=568069 RepID=A0A1J1IAV0_9DIPT|nr:CLUMA_CG009976, isoform A [Clunio marinus]
MENLIWTVKNGELDDLKSIVDSQNIQINQDINGRTLLHYAADYGQSDVVSYLISKGADALDKHGISALLAAIWEGHTNCVKILINSGASRTGTAPDGTSYVDAAEKPEIKALLGA